MCCYKRCEQAPESSKTEIKPKQYCVCTSFRAPFWIIWRMLVLLLSSCNWSFVSTDHKRIEMKWNSNLNSTDIFFWICLLFLLFGLSFNVFFSFVFVIHEIKVDSRIIFDILISLFRHRRLGLATKGKKTTKRDTDLVFQDSENCLVTGCIWP